MPIGKVYSQDYYYDYFVSKLDENTIKEFIEYDQADVDITRELMPDNALEWCYLQFGNPGGHKPYGRWYVHEGAVWFRDEKDYLLWVLRWGK